MVEGRMIKVIGSKAVSVPQTNNKMQNTLKIDLREATKETDLKSREAINSKKRQNLGLFHEEDLNFTIIC
jgi:hypothetical protein